MHFHAANTLFLEINFLGNVDGQMEVKLLDDLAEAVLMFRFNSSFQTTLTIT